MGLFTPGTRKWGLFFIMCADFSLRDETCHPIRFELRSRVTVAQKSNSGGAVSKTSVNKHPVDAEFLLSFISENVSVMYGSPRSLREGMETSRQWPTNWDLNSSSSVTDVTSRVTDWKGTDLFSHVHYKEYNFYSFSTELCDMKSTVRFLSLAWVLWVRVCSL